MSTIPPAVKAAIDQMYTLAVDEIMTAVIEEYTDLKPELANQDFTEEKKRMQAFIERTLPGLITSGQDPVEMIMYSMLAYLSVTYGVPA